MMNANNDLSKNKKKKKSNGYKKNKVYTMKNQSNN